MDDIELKSIFSCFTKQAKKQQKNQVKLAL